jgi:DNA N-6-adenine-methyltransferase Dam
VDEMNRVMFSRQSVHWATPEAVYSDLDKEFRFTLDPCPLNKATLDCLRSWEGERVFCNPPYGPLIRLYLQKVHEAVCAVFLLPARTDTKWFHDYCLTATEIRFIKGRLKFGESKNSALFPSMVVVFK